MPRFIARLGKAIATIGLVLWFLFAILVIALRYVVLPHADDYRGDIERIASRATGETVRIGALSATWRGLRPTLALRDVEVVDAQGVRTLTLPAATATLSWRSLTARQLRFSSLVLDGADLVVRRDAEGQLFVAGYPIRHKATPDDRGAEWLLAQHEIRILRGRVTWHDEMPAQADAAPPPDLVLADVGFALERSGWTHRAALRATPPGTLAAPIDLRMTIAHPLFADRVSDPAGWSGEVYANVASGDVSVWRPWLPLPDTFDNGRGRVRAWLRFARADQPAGNFVHRLVERIQRPIPVALDRIADVTADLALDDLAVHWGTMNYAALASVDGRVVASQTTDEQHLAARHMALQPRGGIQVQPTDFVMDRRVGGAPDDESGSATLGAVDIGVSLGLVPQPLVPPPLAERLAALKPHGSLDRVAVTWTGSVAAPKTFVADVRFTGVGIAAQAPTAEAIAKSRVETVAANGLVRKPHEAFGQPGIDRIDGTLHAVRNAGADQGVPVTEATIALSGRDVLVTAPGLFDDPSLKFAQVGGDVHLKVVGGDLEVRVNHGRLENPDLAATVEMVFRHGPRSGSVGSDGASGRGWIDLDARLSRADVARVPRYLPNIIGARARSYLTRALIAGRVDGASLRMLGALERLDLRNQPGALAVPYATPIQAVVARNAPLATAPARPSPDVGRSDATAEPIFHAEVRIRDATYRYGPARNPDDPPLTDASGAVIPSIAWPPFDHLDADLVFDQARMFMHARTARVYGFTLQDVSAELPALADPAHVLRVLGHGSGPLQDLVRFINEGPMARWLRHATDTTRATGTTTLALALDLPLTHPRDAAVAGTLGFADNELALNAVTPPFRQIRGRVDFSDRGLAIDGLTGQTLGGPLRIDAKTGSDGWIDLHGAGVFDMRALRAESAPGATGMLQTPVSAGLERAARVMSGSARYVANMRMRSSRVAALSDDAPDTTTTAAPPGRSDLVVESDLVGLAIDLPAPLAKPADASWPLRVELSRVSSPGANATDSETIHASLADRVDVAVTRRRDAQGAFAVDRAAYWVGSGADSGVATTSGPADLVIDLPALDLDAWRAAAQKLAADQPATDKALAGTSVDRFVPVRATLRTPALRAASRDFTNVTVTAERVPTGWAAQIAADQVAGKLSYTDVSGRTDQRNGVAPASSGRVVARLSKLSIPASESGRAHVDDALTAGRQKDFPAIDLVADDFELRGRPLGRLEVVAENLDAGGGREWRLETLGLVTPEARFAAHGSWGRDGADENTHLDFDLTSSDVGALMDRFGLTRTIKNGSAHLSGNAAWQGSPTAIDFATLSGNMQLAADKGQFLKADPGIAKLLNILSLQGLARRLTLDFSDVVGAGFAFDTVRADATMKAGIATTDDFTMRGVLAVVKMAGSADLEHETTNLHVVVLPQINAGAASLGLAVVNPVIGLGTFVAQYLFKDRISQALSFEYNVTGPWSRPDVVKIDRNGKVTPVVPKTRAAEARNP